MVLSEIIKEISKEAKSLNDYYVVISNFSNNVSKKLAERNSLVYKITEENREFFSYIFGKIQTSAIKITRENRKLLFTNDFDTREVFNNIVKGKNNKEKENLLESINKNKNIKAILKEHKFKDCKDFIDHYYYNDIALLVKDNLSIVEKSSNYVLGNIEDFNRFFADIYNIYSISQNSFKSTVKSTIKSYKNIIDSIVDILERISYFSMKLSGTEIISKEQIEIEKKWLEEQIATIVNLKAMTENKRKNVLFHFSNISDLYKKQSFDNKGNMADLGSLRKETQKYKADALKNQREVLDRGKTFIEFIELIINEMKLEDKREYFLSVSNTLNNNLLDISESVKVNKNILEDVDKEVLETLNSTPPHLLEIKVIVEKEIIESINYLRKKDKEMHSTVCSSIEKLDKIKF